MIPIKEFIALCPKSYSYVLDTGKEERKGKGTSKVVLEKEIHHNDYRDILISNKDIYKDMIMIKSLRHQLYTISMKKKALCSFSDKRYFFNANEALPHGHYKLNQTR